MSAIDKIKNDSVVKTYLVLEIIFTILIFVGLLFLITAALDFALYLLFKYLRWKRIQVLAKKYKIKIDKDAYWKSWIGKIEKK
jgi:hypothetical protein